MAILMMFEAPGATPEQYQEVNDHMGVGEDYAPPGLISHVAGRGDDSLVVLDVWESREALERFFAERLGQALAATGVEAPEPRVMPVHNLIVQGAGRHAGTLVLIEVPGLRSEAYDRLAASLDAHVGDGTNHPAVSHVAALSDDGMFVADVWGSPEEFGRFAETEIGPAGASIGLGPIEPRFVPVLNRIRGAATVR